MSEVRALVVGASIAGPMTAYWLAKAGVRVTVIERYPQLRTGGQNIDIRTSGVTIMRKIPGMEAAVRAKTTTMDGISLMRPDGRPYGVLKATGNPDRQTLVSEYEIFRGDLSQIIYDLTKNDENISYVFGEQVTSIRQREKEEDGPLTVEFANGLPTAEYDVVVACDGATSRTRAIGLQCGVRDHMKPTNCWAAYFSIKQNILKGSTVGQGYSAAPGRFLAVGPDPTSSGNRVGMIARPPPTDPDPARPFRTALEQGDRALRQYIAQFYRGIGWKTDDIIDEMLEAKDFYATEMAQVLTPNIHKGRFVMVGDAGYAPGPTGFGTTLAMTGAYLLAGEIVSHKGDLAAGIRGYEERMRPIITHLQKIPPFALDFMAPQTAWGLWLRNNLFALVTWSGIVDLIQKFFGGAFAETDKNQLPEYQWIR